MSMGRSQAGFKPITSGGCGWAPRVGVDEGAGGCCVQKHSGTLRESNSLKVASLFPEPQFPHHRKATVLGLV